MARSYEMPVFLKLTTTGNSDFTVPSGKKWMGRYLTVVNTTGTSDTFVICKVVSGTEQRLWSATVAGGAPLQLDLRHVWKAGEIVRVRQGGTGNFQVCLTVLAVDV